MKEQKSDQKFVDDIKQALDHSCERLDAQTLSRLNHIRHQALEGTRAGNKFIFYQRPLLSGSALAVCALLLGFGFYFNINAESELGLAQSELEDIEILSAEDNFELYA
ncbi:DUF3619 family protein, partial [Haliea sp. AH-315-K21]|nr:DUF3619 family protein [Haliea sp. AH-315-K21]